MLRVFLFVALLVKTSDVHGASIVKRYENTRGTDLCDSKIYCKGELLKTVQLAEIYNDSKTFVDLYQVNDPSITLANFNKLMSETNNKPNRSQIEKYVKDNFEKINETVPWSPPDWQPNPSILKRIEDPNFRDWVNHLNGIWKNLSRHVSSDVIRHPERHSLIPVENGFIVPGGRFQESYYWDSYWVVEGLLLSEMKETAKGILLNFLSMVQRFGFIPNGGRIYYLMRSHPPLLIPMVEKYLEATGDIEFLEENLITMEKEFAYFQREKTIDVIKNGKTYRMAHYTVTSEGPRPESYREDYEQAAKLPEAQRQGFFQDMKAAAESGWDFSSRWFIANNGEIGNLSDISTRNIIPVDLNAFLQRNARLLADYNELLGNIVKAKNYRNIARSYQRAIDEVLWNETLGIWLDYDVKNNRQRNSFYPTNLTPLYTKSFDPLKAKIYARRAVDYLKSQGIGDYMGGTPTSLYRTGEQWDAPNAWPPLQSIIVQGLYNTNAEPALGVAKELASRWLRANYLGFEEYGQMFEKYDSGNPGESGDGGEYVPQQGFGWTNGIVFEFLNMYPDATVVDSSSDEENNLSR